MRELLVRCQYDKLKDCIESEEGWKKFEDEKTYPDGITVVARYSACLFLLLINEFSWTRLCLTELSVQPIHLSFEALEC